MSQSSHLNGRSPVCFRMCLCNSAGRTNILLQMLHLWFLAGGVFLILPPVDFCPEFRSTTDARELDLGSVFWFDWLRLEPALSVFTLLIGWSTEEVDWPADDWLVGLVITDGGGLVIGGSDCRPCCITLHCWLAWWLIFDESYLWAGRITVVGIGL